jgi:hexosaminidase
MLSPNVSRYRSGTCPRAVKAGLRCIMSDQGTWYLDHLDVPWDKFYLTEPHLDITDAAEQELVIGGEVCMWGETVDASDILQTIWPRAAAAAGKKYFQLLLYILLLRFQWALFMTILWIS